MNGLDDRSRGSGSGELSPEPRHVNVDGVQLDGIFAAPDGRGQIVSSQETALDAASAARSANSFGVRGRRLLAARTFRRSRSIWRGPARRGVGPGWPRGSPRAHENLLQTQLELLRR